MATSSLASVLLGIQHQCDAASRSNSARPHGPTQPEVPPDSVSLLLPPSFPLTEAVHPQFVGLSVTNTNIPTKEMQPVSESPRLLF